MALEEEQIVVALVGHPRVDSRTAGVAVTLAAAIGSRLRPAASVELIELGKLGANVLDPEHPAVVDVRARIQTARVSVVASPTYKASYTGLLKVFLDGYAGGAWTGQVAIPAMVAGSPAHGHAVDFHLRPLLEELGALCPASFFVTEAELPELEAAVASWVARVEPLLAL